MARKKLKIAVVGSGVAGLTAAYILNKLYDITVFEKNDYPGGHTHTIVIDKGPDRGTPVDTGFIVMNHRNYPLFTKLLDRLGVALRDSDMSFGYSCLQTGIVFKQGAERIVCAAEKYRPPVLPENGIRSFQVLP